MIGEHLIIGVDSGPEGIKAQHTLELYASTKIPLHLCRLVVPLVKATSFVCSGIWIERGPSEKRERSYDLTPALLTSFALEVFHPGNEVALPYNELYVGDDVVMCITNTVGCTQRFVCTFLAERLEPFKASNM